MPDLSQVSTGVITGCLLTLILAVAGGAWAKREWMNDQPWAVVLLTSATSLVVAGAVALLVGRSDAPIKVCLIIGKSPQSHEIMFPMRSKSTMIGCNNSGSLIDGNFEWQVGCVDEVGLSMSAHPSASTARGEGELPTRNACGWSKE